MNSMKNATTISNLQKRHRRRQLDQIVGQLPSILRDNDVYLSGQFDDEGGYYLGTIYTWVHHGQTKWIQRFRYNVVGNYL